MRTTPRSPSQSPSPEAARAAAAAARPPRPPAPRQARLRPRAPAAPSRAPALPAAAGAARTAARPRACASGSSCWRRRPRPGRRRVRGLARLQWFGRCTVAAGGATARYAVRVTCGAPPSALRRRRCGRPRGQWRNGGRPRGPHHAAGQVVRLRAPPGSSTAPTPSLTPLARPSHTSARNPHTSARPRWRDLLASYSQVDDVDLVAEARAADGAPLAGRERAAALAEARSSWGWWRSPQQRWGGRGLAGGLVVQGWPGSLSLCRRVRCARVGARPAEWAACGRGVRSRGVCPPARPDPLHRRSAEAFMTLPRAETRWLARKAGRKPLPRVRQPRRPPCRPQPRPQPRRSLLLILAPYRPLATPPCARSHLSPRLTCPAVLPPSERDLLHQAGQPGVALHGMARRHAGRHVRLPAGAAGWGAGGPGRG
jgi:hypothetical protein